MKGRGISLRLRLSAGAGGLALLAILAALLATFGVRQALSLGEDSAGAQRRIDAYGTLSARITEVVLTPPEQRAMAAGAVLEDFARLDQMIGADVALVRDEAALNRAAQGKALGQMRGAFLQLMQDLDKPGDDPALRDATLNAFAGIFAPLMRGQVEYNSLRRDAALTALEALQQRMVALSIAVVLAVALVLVVLYLLVIAPLMARLVGATDAATLVKGEALPVLLPRGARDELGLLFARLNRLIARLDRRRAAVAADREALETVVADRTAALQGANARLSRIDEDRRRFFADVSHELRTPLTVIMAEAELATASCPPGAAQSLATIRARAVRLNRRIEDLLRIARSDSGQLELDPRPTDLDAILDAAVEDMRPLLVRSRFTIQRDRAATFPVEADPDWLRQILGGLIGNAVKHAGAGATLRLASGIAGDRSYCEITDDGPGLSSQAQADLATRFSIGAGGQGSFGIGLALARWVTEAQGGVLTVTSPVAAGRGFSVRVMLPAAEAVSALQRASA
jgi:two-component system, OmpR family, sensor kinase